MKTFNEWLILKEDTSFLSLPPGVDSGYLDFFNSLNVVQKKRLFEMAKKYTERMGYELPEALEYVLSAWIDKKAENEKAGMQYTPGISGGVKVKSWSTTRNYIS